MFWEVSGMVLKLLDSCGFDIFGVLHRVILSRPRPRSPGEGRAGCARATGITSVSAPKRSARGERSHYITKRGQMENAVVEVDILGRTSKDDDSDVEAYTTLEIKTGECLVSMMEEGRIRQMGDDLWLLDTGATGHST